MKTDDRGPARIGSPGPLSPLRTLDKLTWRLDGGSTGAAAQVRDPWQVTRGPGLRSPDRRPSTASVQCCSRPAVPSARRMERQILAITNKFVTERKRTDRTPRAGTADLA